MIDSSFKYSGSVCLVDNTRNTYTIHNAGTPKLFQLIYDVLISNLMSNSASLLNNVPAYIDLYQQQQGSDGIYSSCLKDPLPIVDKHYNDNRNGIQFSAVLYNSSFKALPNINNNCNCKLLLLCNDKQKSSLAEVFINNIEGTGIPAVLKNSDTQLTITWNMSFSNDTSDKGGN